MNKIPREWLDLPFGEEPVNNRFDPIAELKQKKGVKDKMVAVIYNAVLSIAFKVLKIFIPKASKFMEQWIKDNIIEYIPIIESKIRSLEVNAKATPKIGDDVIAFVIRTLFELVKSLLKV